MSRFRSFVTTMLSVMFLVMTPGSPLIKIVSADPAEASITLSPVVQEQQGSEPKYVFDVVIHKPEEMNKLLGRIEQLSTTLPPAKEDPSLALVLHGPEIAFFTRNNYKKYMKLVDRAAALDKKGIIDVKVCDTMIREMDLEEAELPDFVEHVPYGPAEVERLIKQGFIKM